MPIGLFVLLFLTVAIFRRARRSGRSGVLWAALLWTFAFLFGIVCSVGYMLVLAVTTNPEVSEAEFRSMMYLPTVIGMCIGCLIALTLAGRINARDARTDTSG